MTSSSIFSSFSWSSRLFGGHGLGGVFRMNIDIMKSSGDVFQDLGVERPSTVASHTPGPWCLKQVHAPSDEYGYWYHQIVAGEGYSEDGFSISGIIRPEDARLINAAPEVFEALYRLVTDCKIAGLQEQAGFDCWIAMADRAIAKVLGEPND